MCEETVFRFWTIGSNEILERRKTTKQTCMHVLGLLPSSTFWAMVQEAEPK